MFSKQPHRERRMWLQGAGVHLCSEQRGGLDSGNVKQGRTNNKPRYLCLRCIISVSYMFTFCRSSSLSSPTLHFILPSFPPSFHQHPFPSSTFVPHPFFPPPLFAFYSLLCSPHPSSLTNTHSLSHSIPLFSFSDLGHRLTKRRHTAGLKNTLPSSPGPSPHPSHYDESRSSTKYPDICSILCI